MAEVLSNGWSIHWETVGDEANSPILMALGLSHRLAHWGTLPELLASNLRVILFDCRGMGASERRDEAFTIDDEVGDMAAVLDAAGVSQAIIYGRSRGGMLAQAFALRHPERTRALVLSGTSHRGPSAVPSTERVNRTMNITPEMTREQIFAGQNEAMASPGWKVRDPDVFNALLATDLEAPPRRFAVIRQQESVANWTSDGRLRALRCPTLVLCGADDGMVPPGNSRQIAEQIPGARLELIPQCGHLPMLEKPREVADLVLEFERSL